MKKFPRRFFNDRQAGFSLVEMIGVLAIIAILAVVIVPKVFSTISSSRITSAVGSITSMKTAVSEFAGKYGTIPLTNNNSRIDELLVAQDFLEQRLTLKIGTQRTATTPVGATWGTSSPWTLTAAGNNQTTQSRVTCQTVAPAAIPGSGANPTNFRLDGVTNLPAGSRVVAVAIPGLTATEARELSLRIDGEAMTAAAGVADDRGKVAYTIPAGAGTYTAHVYLAHQ
jgi:prepilin-type N-terminal cleavage/methylation domain-containing protein